jgi:2,4-dienoyl-CoA reductase-like NADH-dependent reductase (Old Yellow Enzyme family)
MLRYKVKLEGIMGNNRMIIAQRTTMNAKEDMLFTPARIGNLTLPNRLIRSGTAEHLADRNGHPLPGLSDCYRALAEGGVGLIISGHMYVHPSGQSQPQMTGIYSDEIIPLLARAVDAVHQAGGLVAAQINHSGLQTQADVVAEPIAPSSISAPFIPRTPRAMSGKEVEMLIEAYGQAARRAKAAGFDAVQVHAAHGYLISEFLSPFANRRTDEWGGSPKKRMNFLRAVCKAVRQQVGREYPVIIKLGCIEGVEGGLQPDEAMGIVAELEGMGLDGLEISCGMDGDKKFFTVRKGIVKGKTEAYFRPIAHQARAHTRLPIALVGGLRSRPVMEDILSSGDADFISMARPFIHEPDLPKRLKAGTQDASTCLGANNCWPTVAGDSVRCKCPQPKVKASR